MKRSPFLACGAFVVVVLVLAGVSRVAAADGDTRLGTWKLNLAKSRYYPGPAPKSATRTYELFEGDGVKYTQEAVNGDGSRTTTTFSAHYDGKDYRWTVNANFDTIALKRLDAYTVNTINKKDGKRVQTSRIVVSKDGKTLTNTQKGTNASGQRVNNVLVFDRQ